MIRYGIGIIGAGWLGGSVGRSLAAAGHQVVMAARHRERVDRQAQGLPNIQVGSLAAAAVQDIILLATPFDALSDIAGRFGAGLGGKIVIDATNPPGDSEAGHLGRRIGVASLVHHMFPKTRLVRCFSAVDATCIEQGHGYDDPRPLGIPLASDDGEALTIACTLVRDMGCVPVPTGALDSARLFQRGTPAFRANTNADRLRDLMGLAAEV